MRTKETQQTVTATSPAAASTVIHTVPFTAGPMMNAERLVIDAALQGATGGTLDVYLQRKLATNIWVDWIHFPQLASGAAAIKYTVSVTGDNTAIVVTGQSTDASATGLVALAANTNTNTIPTGTVRIVFVAGASTSAGAAQTITITPFAARH